VKIFKLSAATRGSGGIKQPSTAPLLEPGADSESEDSDIDPFDVYVHNHVRNGKDLAEEEKAMITSYLDNPPGLHVRR